MSSTYSLNNTIFKIIVWVRQRSRRFLILVAALLDILIGLIDHLTGNELSFSIFYIIPVVLVSRNARKPDGAAISLLCAVTWMIADFYSGRVYSHPLTPYWNALVRLGFYLIISFALVRIRSTMASLERLTITDPLTGSLNPRGFHERALKEIERSQRYGNPFSVAYLDLDNFKTVNDSFGHSTGDALLVRITDLINGGIRKTDVLARLGGDEFAVLFSETEPEAAQTAMARITEKVSEAMRMNGWPVTLSVGLITFRIPPTSVDEMIRKADDLMYEAKTSGKNTIRFDFHPKAPQDLDGPEARRISA